MVAGRERLERPHGRGLPGRECGGGRAALQRREHGLERDSVWIPVAPIDEPVWKRPVRRSLERRGQRDGRRDRAGRGIGTVGAVYCDGVGMHTLWHTLLHTL